MVKNQLCKFSLLLKGRLHTVFVRIDVIFEQRERVFHQDIQTRENNV